MRVSVCISIHALLTESDQLGVDVLPNTFRISIHALLTESDRRQPVLVLAAVDISIHALLTESDDYGLEDGREFSISIHALLTESDQVCVPGNGLFYIFQSTLSSRRATKASGDNQAALEISIHALLTESDHLLLGHLRALYPISIHALLTESDQNPPIRFSISRDFNPRSPHGERRVSSCSSPGPRNFNPRSPHGERPGGGSILRCGALISIHALLTESDGQAGKRNEAIHLFQSTLSSRRATNVGFGVLRISGNFNPRSPHGERRPVICVWHNIHGISIHALLTESDGLLADAHPDEHLFQSTLSSRRATSTSSRSGAEISISIHALLTESDCPPDPSAPCPCNFNPRSPHGERQQIPPNWPYRFCLKCQF